MTRSYIQQTYATCMNTTKSLRRLADRLQAIGLTDRAINVELMILQLDLYAIKIDEIAESLRKRK